MSRFYSNLVMPRFFVRVPALLAVLLTPVFAQTPAPVSDPNTPIPQPVAVPSTAPSEKPLTLEECIALAMQKNFDLQIQGFSTEIARENVNIASADFLPTITASTDRTLSHGAGRLRTNDDGTTTQLSGDSNTTDARVGINERLPQTNGVVGLSSSLTRGSTQDPPYRGGLTATLSQPLLKNAGSAVARANINRSKLGLGIAFLNYRSRVLTVIRDTENAYYNLVGARETLRIRQLTLDYNRRLFEENQARRATGVATDLDVLTAEYGVANARRAFVQAEQNVRDREDGLLSLINTPDFEVRPGPVAFEDYKADPVSFATSYKLARENYPDTLSTEETIKQLEIDVATARRNRLPTLNLDASYGHTANDHSYYSVVETLPRDDRNNMSLGFTASLPWGMKADRARYRSAVANRDSQKLRLEQLEMNLLVQVRTSVRAVEANVVAVEIAVKATELAARQYELQKARFDAGLATSRLVLQAQDDLETARFNELSAKVTLRGAVAELHRLEGTSIRRFRVQLPE